MKKSLVALAVLAAAGAASAQSSVTLFGVADLGYQYGKSATNSLSRMGQDGIASSRLGFRGTEDLGGGMNASFWLEAGISPDSGVGGGTNVNNQVGGAVAAGGGLIFNRRSTVSLGGGFGELRLGRDYTATFWNYTVFDPFGTNGVGTTRTLAGNGAATSIAGNLTQVRASNAFGYFLPGNLGGFYGQFQWYKGENLSNAAAAKTGDGYALRGGFANGPVNVALAVGQLKTGAATSHDTWNLGGSYDLGVAKLMGHYDAQDNTAGVKQTGYLLGATMPLGAGELKGSYSVSKTNAATSPKSTQWAVGYVHNLSKRTAVYATLARVGNSGGANAVLNGATASVNNSSTGYDIGLRHTF
jgi:predicted porin